MTKTKLSVREKAERMAEWLRDSSQHVCEDQGGYPDDIAIIGDHLVVATIDQDKPMLYHWSLERVAQWYDDVETWRLEEPEGDLDDALRECWPSTRA